MADRITGTVKWFDASKGYGFISRSDRKGDVYVNISDVKKSGLGDLEEGQYVGFELEKTPKGSRAVNLDTGWPAGYLEGGYFDEKGNIESAVVDTWAEQVAQILGMSGIASHQLRRFFNQLRAIEAKLETEDFDAIRSDIHTLKRDAAYAVGRGVVRGEFKEFIDRNVDLAVRDEKSFRRGFLEHFQSVLAYFTYHFRNR
jgi:CRISPR type III-A-associated protein Csm2